MTTFNSTEKHVFHYLTFVTFKRVPVFKSAVICNFFIEALKETKLEVPFKLVAYVIMRDHAHLIVNPLACNIELLGKTLKGKSAKKILDWLKATRHSISLEKLRRNIPGKRNHTYSVWQKKVKSVDLKSWKFIAQKTNYVHMNPVRAALCDHPSEWEWSSYRAYFPHISEEVPIEPDMQPFWEEHGHDGKYF